MPSFPADGNFVGNLAEGVDYEFGSDSLYPREERSEVADAVEIDGRDWQVVDRLTVEQLPARVAALWRRRGVVARVEVRRRRGRAAYLADLHADGSYSRPWRGALAAN